jgi:hypothetical protein
MPAFDRVASHVEPKNGGAKRGHRIVRRSPRPFCGVAVEGQSKRCKSFTEAGQAQGRGVEVQFDRVTRSWGSLGGQGGLGVSLLIDGPVCADQSNEVDDGSAAGEDPDDEWKTVVVSEILGMRQRIRRRSRQASGIFCLSTQTHL